MTGLAVLLVAGLSATGGYRAFSGWRARDLAAKAKQNFEKANYRMALLQITSARDLRPMDPEVLRVSAQIEASLGRGTALEYFDRLQERSALTPEDLRIRAEAAARFGTDKQAAEAIEALQASGNTTEAASIRVIRHLRQGDLDRAIADARKAAAATEDPAIRLSLSRLLLQRYGSELAPQQAPSAEALLARKQMIDLVDSLISTSLKGQALAFGLASLPADPEVHARWAEAAMKDVQVENPALLPAATVLVSSGRRKPAEIYQQLQPVFDSSPLDRRAAFALWLSGAGLPEKALTLVTAQDSGESTLAFGAHTESLFRLGKNEAVIAAADAAPNIDADVKLAARARAEYALGRGAQSGANSLREAIQEATRRGRLESILPAADALGASSVADEKLIELCGEPATADYVFRIARDRLSRRGRQALLATAFDRARTASPGSAAVKDYARYVGLLAGETVAPSETVAAVAAEPANATFRITHALGLLRAKQPAEALAVFDDITLFANRLPPGQLAVLAAVLGANGDTRRARAAAGIIDPSLLTKEEYVLIAPYRRPSAD